ncbi:MAG: hypothetical protein ABIJ12_10150 [bacterium]
MSQRNRKKLQNNSDSFIDSFLFKFSSKLLFGIVIVVTFLTIAQCTIKKPESPTWETQFVVPVINRTYYMEEIIDKIGNDNLQIDDSGNVVFSITEDLDTVNIDPDNLATDDISYSVNKELGPVDIDPPTVAPVSLSLVSLSGLSIPLPGDSAVIPDTTFDVSSNMPTITTFSTATFSQGYVNVIIANALGITLDNITIDLVNSSTMEVISSGTHSSPLPTATSTSIPIDLVGTTVPNGIDVVATYHTAGGIVGNYSSRYINTGIEFSDTLQVVSATTRIPAFNRSETATVELAEDDRIDSASISSGLLTLTITNATDIDADLTITVPDILTAQGYELTLETALDANNTVIINTNLAGYRLVPQTSVVPQEISIEVLAEVLNSGTEQKVIASTDYFDVSADLSNIEFGYVTGLFQTVSASFDGISQDIELPTGFENFELVNAVLTLEVVNGIDLPGDVDIQLNGNNGKNLLVAGDISPRGLASSYTSVIQNTDVANFLSPIPTHIEASGEVTFGDGVYEGTITANDFVFAKVIIESPLSVIINESTIDVDIQSETIEQKDIELITDHFIEGRFIYRITNHLPVGAHINVFIDPDSLNLNAANAQVTLDSLFISAAPSDPITGLVTDTSSSDYQTIMLDSLDIKVLENETVYIGTEVVLHGSDGLPVTVAGDDFIKIIGRIEVEYLFDGEF